MKNNLQIKNLQIEKEHLYFCGTIFGKNKEDIVTQAKEFLQQSVAMLEVRGDAVFTWGNKMPGFRRRFIELGKALDEIHQLAPDVPVIFTLRTKKEGGRFRGNKKAYRYVVELIGFSQEVDIVDVEMKDATLDDVKIRDFEEVYNGDNLIEYLHMYDKPVLLSRHILGNISFKERMRAAKEAMELQAQSDAAICKLAVYVENEEQLKEYQQLLNSNEKWLNRPHIGIAMGEAGKESRYNKNWCGSCISFVAGKKVAAPGQLSMEEIKELCYNSKIE